MQFTERKKNVPFDPMREFQQESVNFFENYNLQCLQDDFENSCQKKDQDILKSSNKENLTPSHHY